MKVLNIMTKPVFTISYDSTVGEAADVMIERNVSCLPVLGEDGKVIGILTHTNFGMRRDSLPHGESIYTMLDHWVDPDKIDEATDFIRGRLVKEVMVEPVTTIEEDSPVEDAVKLMVNEGINRLPVMRGEEDVGIITRHDLLKLLANHPMSSQLWTPTSIR